MRKRLIRLRVSAGAADQTMRLLTLKLFRHVHGLLENNRLYALKNKKLFERSPVERFFNESALPLVFGTLGD